MGRRPSEPAAPAINVKTLHAKIGGLTLVDNFVQGALGNAGLSPTTTMIGRSHAPSVTRQAQELAISRDS